tara:strand:- start:1163 stop:1375 length:213 start_codon:yes stop_codon:yes gene_type:complete
MELSTQEKEDLKGLIEHRGFKVVERLASQLELDTLRQLKVVSLADKEECMRVNASQNYLLGAEALLETIK